MARLSWLFGSRRDSKSKDKHRSSSATLNFTTTDILDLMKAIPHNPSSPQQPFEGGLYGAGKTKLYDTSYLLKRLDDYLSIKDEPFTIQTLAECLDITPDDTRKLLDDRVVQSTNAALLFPPLYLEQLTAQFMSQAAMEFISVEVYCTVNELPYSWILSHPKISQDCMLKDGDNSIVLKSWDNSKRYTKSYLFSHHLLKELQKNIAQRLQNAIDSNTTVQLIPTMDADTYYAIAKKVATDFAGVIKQPTASSDRITFLPTCLLEEKAQSIMTTIESGEVSYMDLKAFYSQCRDLFPDKQSRTAYERKTTAKEDVITVSQYWVCNSWLNSEIASLRSLYIDLGFVDMTSAFSHVPSDLRSTLLDLATTKISRPPKPLKFLGCLVSKWLMQDATTAATELAVGQAEKNWTVMIAAKPDSSPRRPSLNTTVIISNLASKFGFSKEVSTLLYARIASTMNQAYLKTLDERSIEQKKEFASFWRERVLCPWAVYSSGIENIPAESPQELVPELQATLADHMRQLIYECIQTAKKEHTLPLSSVYRGAILQLESSLDVTDFQLMKLVLNVFATELDIDTSLDKDSLIASKEKIMGDIFDSLHVLDGDKQEDSDVLDQSTKDARLILCVLISLHARVPGMETGLVYATGKSVSRFFKALRIAVEGPGAVVKTSKKTKKGKKSKNTDESTVATPTDVDSNVVTTTVGGIPADVLAAIPFLSKESLAVVEQAITAVRKSVPVEDSVREEMMKMIS